CTKLVKDIELVREPLTFSLDAPLHTTEGTLPPGEYYCQYANEGGYFFEAPATLNGDYLFAGGTSGGVYVSRGKPRSVRLFVQDKHPSTAYSPNLGMYTFGGSGFFRLTDELPADVAGNIAIEGD
ncbi:MAG: hypothetical protein RKL32_00055, partial [Gammaproteobacteria bacterium]